MLKNQGRLFLPLENWLNVFFWLICLAFTGAVVYLSLQFPASFAPVAKQSKTIAIFGLTAVILILFSAGAIFLRILGARQMAEKPKARSLAEFLVENTPGLSLAALFFVAYFSLAVSLGILPDDNFYDTDPTSWLNRFTAPAGELIEMRPVHPFAFLIFRPFVWFISLFLAGDKFHSALLLNAGTGALCVFLAWVFVKERSANKSFALRAAALLGLSTSHLVLSASLETYIYSAAVLITFLILVSREPRPLKTLVPVGLVTFGITLTNFIQTLIMLAFLDLRISAPWNRRIFRDLAGLAKLAKYTVIVVAASVALAFLQTKMYPTSQPFYIPSNLLAEDRYSYNLLSEGPARALERANALGRAISVFSVVAPRPLVLLKETGCEFPCFQTYKHRWNGALINSYAGLGSLLARTWFVLLLGAAGLFIWSLVKAPKSVLLQASLLTCILFNFILHMNYGDDPLLYSGDWTYAVVFFAALSYKDLAHRKWLQVGFLVFLGLVMVNNLRFLYAVMSTISPYYS